MVVFLNGTPHLFQSSLNDWGEKNSGDFKFNDTVSENYSTRKPRYIFEILIYNLISYKYI